MSKFKTLQSEQHLAQVVKRHEKGDLVHNDADLAPPGGFGTWRGRGITNWRDWMRKNTANGTEIHEILLELARGVPKEVTLKDGKKATIVPTAEVRARVAIHLDEMMHGKAVTQNEQQRAEREAGAMAAIQALSDEALVDRARAVFLRISGGIPEDAQLVADTSEVSEVVEGEGVRASRPETMAESIRNADVKDLDR